MHSGPFFNPSPQRLLLVINDLIDPDLSLRQIATNHNTTVAALTLWMSLPETINHLTICQSAFADRVRLVATANLDAAAAALNRLLTHFSASQHTPDPTLTPEQRQRARELALRAANLLIRLANFRPIAFGSPAREIPNRAQTSPASAPSPAPAGVVSRAQQVPEVASAPCEPTPINRHPAQPQPDPLHTLESPSVEAPPSVAPYPSVPYVPSFAGTAEEEHNSLLVTASPHEHWP